MNRLREKLRSLRGFTMAEMMLCCAIVAIAMGLTGQMLGIGAKTVRYVERESTAEILFRDICEVVRDQLSYAVYIEDRDCERNDANRKIIKYKQPYVLSTAGSYQGSAGRFEMVKSNGDYTTDDYGILVQRYTYPDSTAAEGFSCYDYYPIDSGIYRGLKVGNQSVYDYDVNGSDGFASYVTKVQYDYYPEKNYFDVTVSVQYAATYEKYGEESEPIIEEEFIVIPIVRNVTIANVIRRA